MMWKSLFWGFTLYLLVDYGFLGIPLVCIFDFCSILYLKDQLNFFLGFDSFIDQCRLSISLCYSFISLSLLILFQQGVRVVLSYWEGTYLCDCQFGFLVLLMSHRCKRCHFSQIILDLFEGWLFLIVWSLSMAALTNAKDLLLSSHRTHAIFD